MSGISVFSAFSEMTGIRSGYLLRIRWASALRFSSGCCFLNDRALLTETFDMAGCGGVVGGWSELISFLLCLFLCCEE